MLKSIVLLFFSSVLLFPQSKINLFGFWLLDSNSELIQITTDSIVFNSGFFQEVKSDSVEKEIILNDNVINYEIINNQLILSKSKTVVDTLVRINSETLLPSTTMWIHNGLDNRLLIILKEGASIRMGIILRQMSFPYSINENNLVFIKDGEEVNFNFLIEPDLLKLFPNNSKEVYVYTRLQ